MVAPPTSATPSTSAYVEAAPATSLRTHFRCSWVRTVASVEAATLSIVPDGCVDLIWMEGRIVVAGPDRTAMSQALSPRSVIVGLRFQPAAATGWLDAPMSDLLNQRVPLDELWGDAARRLGDWIGEAADAAEMAARLQAGLEPIARRIRAPDPAMLNVFAICNAVARADSGVGLLADRFGMSERTLRRRCHYEFGYGPKTLERILRLQRFLERARSGRSAGLASCAAAAGYADQAHLSREVRDLCDSSPTALLRQFSA